MITTFHQKRIRGVLGVLPENEYDYDKAQSSEIKDNDIGFMCVWIRLCFET